MSVLRSFRKQVIRNLTGRFLNNTTERGNGARIIDEARSIQRSKQSKGYPEDHDAAFARKLAYLLNADNKAARPSEGGILWKIKAKNSLPNLLNCRQSK